VYGTDERIRLPRLPDDGVVGSPDVVFEEERQRLERTLGRLNGAKGFHYRWTIFEAGTREPKYSAVTFVRHHGETLAELNALARRQIRATEPGDWPSAE
jgi:hypothetical protein